MCVLCVSVEFSKSECVSPWRLICVCGALLFTLSSLEFLQLSVTVMSRPDAELLSPQIREVWAWGWTAGGGTRAAEGSGDLTEVNTHIFTRVLYSNKRAVWSETQTSATSLMSQQSRTITVHVQRPVSILISTFHNRKFVGVKSERKLLIFCYVNRLYNC